MCNKGQPFAPVRWREHKFGNGNHLKKLDPEKSKQRLEDKYIFNEKESL